MRNVEGLKRLCSALTVTGDFKLSRYDELIKLSKNLVFGASLDDSCVALAGFSRDLLVNGSVKLRSCQDILIPVGMVLVVGSICPISAIRARS